MQYLVLKVNNRAGLNIAHYSTSAADLLHLNRGRGKCEPIVNEDIFKVLADRSPSSSAVLRSFKKVVTDCLTQGKAVSLDFEVLVQDKRSVKIEKQLISHWTPCKDEEGQTKYVVLVFSEG